MGYEIRFRKRFLPRSFADLSAMVFMSLVIPAVYWFEVPPGWHVCAVCESTAPPRSRHCNTCNVCVLKKEHHCVFAGCCVGMDNHRYFYIFLFLMWGSTLYCSCLNACFIWPYVGGFNMWAIVRLLLPGVWLLLEPCIDTLYAFLFSINVIGCLFMSVLIYYYTNLLLTNTTTHENNTRKGHKYDQGRNHNLKVTLGERWYLTWVFPTLTSPLPCDGLDWSIHQSMGKTDKHKSK